MDRVNTQQLEIKYKMLSDGENTYELADRKYHDIVDAEYQKTGLNPEVPDIAALPLPTIGKDLITLNARGIDGYTAQKICTMTKAEKLRAIIKIKDIVEPLAFHAMVEEYIHEVLVQSYKKRALSKSPHGLKENWHCENKAILTSESSIFTSTPGFVVLGVPGSGKSTAIGLTLSRYPKGIRHHFSNCSYIQIPIIAVTAFPGSNMGSLLISMAKEIDQILGYESIYTKLIEKKKTIGMKAAFICELVNIFHIGLILIDELELLSKTESTNELLTITAKTGVALGAVGTEDSIRCFDVNSKLGRRLCGNMIIADKYTQDSELLGRIIEKIWKYQWTNRPDELTDGIKRALIEESSGNLDLLTNIIICAQREVILNERKIEEKLIRRIANGELKLQREWVRTGSMNLKRYLCEKITCIQSINNAAQELEAREFKEEYSKQISTEKKGYIRESAMAETVSAIEACGFSYSPECIKKEYLQLEKTMEDFKELASRKRTNLVLRNLNTKSKEKAAEKPKTAVDSHSIQKIRESLGI